MNAQLLCLLQPLPGVPALGDGCRKTWFPHTLMFHLENGTSKHVSPAIPPEDTMQNEHQEFKCKLWIKKESPNIDVPACSVAQLCPTLCNLMDCSPPGSSVHGISQVRTLEWVAVSFSGASSRSRDRTPVSCIGRQIFYH